jgi:hypothetical protein
MALQPLWTLSAFSVSYPFTVGRTPWTGDQPVQGRYLYTEQHKHRINADIHASSGIRTHDPSVRADEECSGLRPRGHCDTVGTMEHNYKMDFKVSSIYIYIYIYTHLYIYENGVHSTFSEQGRVMGACQHGKGPMGTTTGRELFRRLTDYQFFKNDTLSRR